MINFPVLVDLNVDDYGLYPGTEDAPGLHSVFQTGLTLVMGANGLGKSTLVSMMYRMCAGAVDVPPAGSQAELGNQQLILRETPAVSRTFAVRVHDQAVQGLATLTMMLGSSRIAVTRRLRDLRIVNLSVDDVQVEADESTFRDTVARAANIDSFTDWILLLKYLVFYSDDRNSLVWDKSAQRQMLRLLFLPPDESRMWLELERVFLQLATRFRNQRANLTRDEAQLRRDEGKLAKVNATTGQIEQLADELAALNANLFAVRSELPDLENNANDADRENLQAELERESAYQNLEGARFQDIQAAFPSPSASAAYLIGQILSDAECAACGAHVPGLRDDLVARAERNQCVICGTERATPPNAPSQEEVDALISRLSAAETHLQQTQARSTESNNRYKTAAASVRTMEINSSRLSSRIETLTATLPDSDRTLKERRADINSRRNRLDELRVEVDRAQNQYRTYVSDRIRLIAERKDDVKKSFAKYAKDFLLETCELIWDAYLVPMGQIGEAIEFHMFEVNMTGTDFGSATRRRAEGEVSESQREFIDLAFRMALIEVAGSGQVGSMVIDTPESSLDAVFAGRAAKVLATFSSHEGNRLVVTSNLIDGDLIPQLLHDARIFERSDPRVVDLIDIARPTAAMRELRGAYDRAVARIFGRAETVD